MVTAVHGKGHEKPVDQIKVLLEDDDVRKLLAEFIVSLSELESVTGDAGVFVTLGHHNETVRRIDGILETLSSEVIRECRVCFREVEGSDQCQGALNACSGWSNPQRSGDWSPAFREMTPTIATEHANQWKLRVSVTTVTSAATKCSCVGELLTAGLAGGVN